MISRVGIILIYNNIKYILALNLKKKISVQVSLVWIWFTFVGKISRTGTLALNHKTTKKSNLKQVIHGYL